jgi:hypothetical protein
MSKAWEKSGEKLNYGIEKGIDFIFDLFSPKQETHIEPKPSPTAAAPEIAPTPPLPTFIEETKTMHERVLEQKRAAKQFLRRLR